MSLSCSLPSAFHFFSSIPAKLCWTHKLMTDGTFLGPTNFCSTWALPRPQCDPLPWPGTGGRLEGPWRPGEWQGIHSLAFRCSCRAPCPNSTTLRRRKKPRSLGHAGAFSKSIPAACGGHPQLTPCCWAQRLCWCHWGSQFHHVTQVQFLTLVFHLCAFSWVSVTEVSASTGSLLKTLP